MKKNQILHHIVKRLTRHFQAVMLIGILHPLALDLQASPTIYGFGVTENQAGKNPNGSVATLVRVDNARDLAMYCESDQAFRIEITKSMVIPNNTTFRPADYPGKRYHSGMRSIRVYPYKEIFGSSPNVTITGNFDIRGEDQGAYHVKLHHLNITNPYSGDGVTIRGQYSNHIAIYNCKIYNCTDCAVDITAGASNVTVAYCKFFNNNFTIPHRFGSQIEASSRNCEVTYHHNWYSVGMQYRLPKVGASKASTFLCKAHLFCNYYNTGEKQMQITVAYRGHVMAENNVFHNSYNPWYFTQVKGGILNTNQESRLKMVGHKFISDKPNAYPQWSGGMLAYRDQHSGSFNATPAPPKFVYYQYQLTPTDQVIAHVKQYAGNVW